MYPFLNYLHYDSLASTAAHVKSKIVQGYAAINHQSLESTKCGQSNAIVKKKKSDCLSRFVIRSRRRHLAGWALVT